MGKEEYYKETNKLKQFMREKEAEISEKDRMIERSKEELEEKERQNRDVVVDRERWKAKYEESQIKCRQQEKEIRKLCEEKNESTGKQTKEAKKAAMVADILTILQKRVSSLEDKMCQMEKPQRWVIKAVSSPPCCFLGLYSNFTLNFPLPARKDSAPLIVIFTPCSLLSRVVTIAHQPSCPHSFIFCTPVGLNSPHASAGAFFSSRGTARVSLSALITHL